MNDRERADLIADAAEASERFGDDDLERWAEDNTCRRAMTTRDCPHGHRWYRGVAFKERAHPR
jgi:hypothetical protein